MHTSLKVQNRYKKISFVSSWITGMDYDEELFEDQQYEIDEDIDDGSLVSDLSEEK